MWWSYPFMILFWSLYIFTPNKKDALLIVAGGGTMEFLTTDSTVKQIPHELSSFVVTQLKSMGEEAKVELGIQSQKDKILDEAKSMTTQQLLDKMKVDTNFANIILNK
jgi:D-arabinose 5-phosphate isomerase GutQ